MLVQKMLVAFVFDKDFGANKTGDIVQLDPDEAKPLVDAGIISEATDEHIKEPDGDEAAAPLEQDAAITRAIDAGFKKMEAGLMASVKATKGVSISNAAQVKTPAIKGFGDLCRNMYKSSKRDQTAINKIRSYEADIRQKAPAGSAEGTSGLGGYLVIPEWTKEIFVKSKKYPDLMAMCHQETISGNTLNIPALSEASMQDGTRGGGILAYWVTEGNVATQSYPNFANVQAVLNTQIVLVPVTNQLLEDNAYDLEGFLSEKVGEEFMWQQDSAVIAGSGSGQPLGLLNQNALITVAKESGQAAGTINFQNVTKMLGRLWPASRQACVWLVNPAVYQQLVSMTFPNAAGTVSAFGGLTFNVADDFQLRILGRPVIECMMTADFGLVGDVILADLSQLYAVQHAGGNLHADISDQVYFTSLQTLFRFYKRYDIRSPWVQAMTDVNGHYAYSPFVALASRGT